MRISQDIANFGFSLENCGSFLIDIETTNVKNSFFAEQNCEVSVLNLSPGSLRENMQFLNAEACYSHNTCVIDSRHRLRAFGEVYAEQAKSTYLLVFVSFNLDKHIARRLSLISSRVPTADSVCVTDLLRCLEPNTVGKRKQEIKEWAVSYPSKEMYVISGKCKDERFVALCYLEETLLPDSKKVIDFYRSAHFFSPDIFIFARDIITRYCNTLEGLDSLRSCLTDEKDRFTSFNRAHPRRKDPRLS